jgi:hypothetical protein
MVGANRLVAIHSGATFVSAGKDSCCGMTIMDVKMLTIVKKNLA